RLAAGRPRLLRRGARLYGVAATVDPRNGQLVLSVVPVTVGQLVGRLRRRGRRGPAGAQTSERGPAGVQVSGRGAEALLGRHGHLEVRGAAQVQPGPLRRADQPHHHPGAGRTAPDQARGVRVDV
ncbi:glycosyltransferase family 2 protein, partial [Micromonospora aurantiaca]|nr:glycosyltransferase family 2 protein [Micromonospora aurantiaca]